MLTNFFWSIMSEEGGPSILTLHWPTHAQTTFIPRNKIIVIALQPADITNTASDYYASNVVQCRLNHPIFWNSFNQPANIRVLNVQNQV